VWPSITCNVPCSSRPNVRAADEADEGRVDPAVAAAGHCGSLL
jgi:hypothetical protein